MFSIQLTASVWAVNRKEPAARSVFAQAAVNLRLFSPIIYRYVCVSLRQMLLKSEQSLTDPKLKGGHALK